VAFFVSSGVFPEYPTKYLSVVSDDSGLTNSAGLVAGVIFGRRIKPAALLRYCVTS